MARAFLLGVVYMKGSRSPLIQSWRWRGVILSSGEWNGVNLAWHSLQQSVDSKFCPPVFSMANV